MIDSLYGGWPDALVVLGDGPALLRVVISREEKAPQRRPKLASPELAERFRAYFGKTGVSASPTASR
jgi:hypothetical protein